MVSKLEWTESRETSPYRNIAAEKLLTLGAEAGSCTLFLWQNRDTVVIGRNQNAWEECRVSRFREEGGTLARRLSGGGAVYHDLGNLNFSFLARREDYDPARQSEVILRAVQKLGVPAERTGRNDFEAEGRKFSGNAFYEQKGCCCHHGTLMMDVDMNRMEQVLTVSGAKLRSRGVASVRARVVNLKEYCPGIHRDQLTRVLLESFEEVYGLPAEPLRREPEETEIRREAVFLASDEWLLGQRIPFTAAMEKRFPWGGVRLELNVNRGRVTEAVCWSDAMEERMIRQAAGVLKDCPYDGSRMAERVRKAAESKTGTMEEIAFRCSMAEDLASLILESVP